MADEQRIKIYIFPKTTPWGVIKHPQKGNVYTNVVNFPVLNKRDEFINEFLIAGLSLDDWSSLPITDPRWNTFYPNWKANVNRADERLFNPINEITFTFKQSLATENLNGRTRSQYLNADFCVVKRPNDNQYYFYTLQVQQEKLGYVIYLAELDVFFTYNLDKNMFNENAYNYVEKAHRVRFKKNDDGTFNKHVDGVLWDVVLKNNIAVEPSRLKRVIQPVNKSFDFVRDNVGLFDNVTGDKDNVVGPDQVINEMKWVVIYMVRPKYTVDVTEDSTVKSVNTGKLLIALGIQALATVAGARIATGASTGGRTIDGKFYYSGTAGGVAAPTPEYEVDAPVRTVTSVSGGESSSSPAWLDWEEKRTVKKVLYKDVRVDIGAFFHKLWANQIAKGKTFGANAGAFNIGGVQEQYSVLLFPYSQYTNNVYVEGWFSNADEEPHYGKAWNPTRMMIDYLLKDNNSFYLKISNLYSLGFKLDGFEWYYEKKQHNNETVFSFILRQKKSAAKNDQSNALRVVRAEHKDDQLTYITILTIRNADKLRPMRLLAYLNFENYDQIADEPALFHPKIHHFEVKTWDMQGKKYSLPRLKINENPLKNKTYYWSLNQINFFSLTDDNVLVYPDHNLNYQSRPMFRGDYLIVNQDDSMTSREERITQFYRDNRNTFNAQKSFDNRQLDLNKQSAIATTVLGAGTSILGAGFGNPLALAGGIAGGVKGGFSIANADLALERNKALREAQIADIKNQFPSIKVGNSSTANVILNNIFDEDTSKITINEITPEKHEEKQIKDMIRNYGYDVKENMKLAKLLNIRKHFEYIQAQNVFNSIKLQVSPRIKQIISGAFAEGVTIWHYRSAEQWKGVNSFDADNSEYEEPSND